MNEKLTDQFIISCNDNKVGYDYNRLIERRAYFDEY